MTSYSYLWYTIINMETLEYMLLAQAEETEEITGVTETTTASTTATSGSKKNKKNKNQEETTTDTASGNTNTDQTATEETTTSTEQKNVSLDDLTKGVDLSNPSWDLFLVGFFLIGALLYGMTLGKDRIIAIMMSIYMALAVVATLPDFVLNIKVNDNYTFQITAFITVFVILFFLLSRQAILNALGPGSDGKWWQVILFSVLHVGLLVSVTMSFMPPQVLSNFSDTTLFLFTHEWTHFGWIIAPIIAMMVVGRNEE